MRRFFRAVIFNGLILLFMLHLGCSNSNEPDYTDVPIITTFTLHDEDPDFPHRGLRMIKDDLDVGDELTFEGYYKYKPVNVHYDAPGFIPIEIRDCTRLFKVNLNENLIEGQAFFLEEPVLDIPEDYPVNQGEYVKATLRVIRLVAIGSGYPYSGYLVEPIQILPIEFNREEILDSCFTVMDANVERLKTEIVDSFPDEWEGCCYPPPYPFSETEFYSKKFYTWIDGGIYSDVMVDFDNGKAICRFEVSISDDVDVFRAISFFINLVYDLDKNSPDKMIVNAIILSGE